MSKVFKRLTGRDEFTKEDGKQIVLALIITGVCMAVLLIATRNF